MQSGFYRVAIKQRFNGRMCFVWIIFNVCPKKSCMLIIELWRKLILAFCQESCVVYIPVFGVHDWREYACIGNAAFFCKLASCGLVCVFTVFNFSAGYTPFAGMIALCATLEQQYLTLRKKENPGGFDHCLCFTA